MCIVISLLKSNPRATIYSYINVKIILRVNHIDTHRENLLKLFIGIYVQLESNGRRLNSDRSLTNNSDLQVEPLLNNNYSAYT